MARKGIILAGGSGTRLYPVTRGVSKQLLPVYDKPMIYYPLCTLMSAGIREFLVITTPEDRERFQQVLEDGSQWGVRIEYMVQDEPRGIAEALILGEVFIGEAAVALILGDNIYFGHGLEQQLQAALEQTDRPTVFGYYVKDPGRYGVVAFDASGRAVDLEEKPSEPRSHYAVTGLYLYPPGVSALARELEPSARGELEITDLNRRYLEAGELQVEILGRGVAWLDTGTHESLLEAATFIETLEKRQGLKVASPEETAWRAGLIDDAQLARLAEPLSKSEYGRYLQSILDTRVIR